MKKYYNFLQFSSYSPESVRIALGHDWQAIFRHWRRMARFQKSMAKETPCEEENAMDRQIALAIGGIAAKLSLGVLCNLIFWIAFFNLI